MQYEDSCSRRLYCQLSSGSIECSVNESIGYYHFDFRQYQDQVSTSQLLGVQQVPFLKITLVHNLQKFHRQPFRKPDIASAFSLQNIKHGDLRYWMLGMNVSSVYIHLISAMTTSIPRSQSTTPPTDHSLLFSQSSYCYCLYKVRIISSPHLPATHRTPTQLTHWIPISRRISLKQDLGNLSEMVR